MYIVIINETHSLFQNQIDLLSNDYLPIEVPQKGLNKDEIFELAVACKDYRSIGYTIVVASPIPLLFKFLADMGIPFKVFHNDKRDKNSKEGWELI